MRAQILDSYDAGQFRLADLPRPVPSPGQALIRIAASGVNPIDYKVRKGLSPYAMPELPAILGTDVAGTVEAVGEGVTSVTPGQAVFGLVGGVKRMPGTLADYVAVDADLLAPKLETLSMREAAALPLVCLTAWEGLVDRARVKPGDKVLVLGGAGGVGHVAVQIARAHGAEVVATVSANKADLVRELGAVPVDREMPIEEVVARHTGGAGFDVVYDTVGGEALTGSFVAVRHYGQIASCAAFGTYAMAPLSLRCGTLSGVFVLLPMLSGIGRAHQGAALREIAALVGAGKLRPVLDPRRFTLEQAHDAHDAVEQGAWGKVVIDVAV